MTSSLVGSEMCIRDRQTTIQRNSELSRQEWEVPKKSRQSFMAVGFKAVSYTHLTLPTICSV
eukprot:12365404-Prorocentrum_lima.AAC.1